MEGTKEIVELKVLGSLNGLVLGGDVQVLTEVSAPIVYGGLPCVDGSRQFSLYVK